MRSATFGLIPNLSEEIARDTLLGVFERMCLCRSFESEVFKAIQEKIISYPVYLSLGQEAIASAMAEAIRNYAIFSQHRCHSTYLAFGGDPVKLRDELLGLPSGTSHGKAGSNCIQYHEKGLNMFGHHGLIGENVPQAVGFALGSGRNTVCFFGDGAAEEDYVFPALGFAVTHKLPILFVCEDNDLSILTKKSVRRSWSITKVAASFGMTAKAITDEPWTIMKTTQTLVKDLPAFVNVYTCRASWHVGAGVDGPPEWDRYAMVKDELSQLGHKQQMNEIEAKVGKYIGEIWDRKQLQKLLKK